MEPYFKLKSLEKFGAGYVRENFDVVGKMSNQYISNDRNLISRLRNLLVEAIHQNPVLPKYIVMALDDDLIKFLNLEARPGIVKAMGRVLNEIMIDHRKVIQTQKEYLHKRSKRDLYPQIIWIEAPFNDQFNNNELRKIYNDCLTNVSKFHEDVTVLALKKIWDPSNGNLFVGESDRYTAQGLATHWAAIDATVRFMDTIYINNILKKTAKKQKKDRALSNMKQHQKKGQSQNRFKWESEKYKKSKRPKSHDLPSRRKLTYDEESSDDFFIEDEGRRTLPKPKKAREY